MINLKLTIFECIGKVINFKKDETNKSESQIHTIIKNIAGTSFSFFKDSINEALPIIASYTVDNVFSLAIANQSFGRIAGGMMCTLTSASFLYKTKIIQKVISSLKRIDQNQEISNQEKLYLSLLFTTMVFGVYQTALGVFEMYNQQTDSSSLDNWTIEQIPIQSPKKEITVEPNRIKSQSLINKLLQCEEAKKLWELNLKAGDINIELSSDLEFGGEWDSLSRTITINSNESPDLQLSTLLFENCNAFHNVGLLLNTYKASIGDLSREEFAMEKEYIEWESAKIHHYIVSKCMKSQGWHPDVDFFEDYFKPPYFFGATFERLWPILNINPNTKGHVDALRDFWDKNYKSTYCAKHPQSLDCK